MIKQALVSLITSSSTTSSAPAKNELIEVCANSAPVRTELLHTMENLWQTGIRSVKGPIPLDQGEPGLALATDIL